ncbi:MAG: secretion system protein [Anaerolineae bacterium]|nr:MAG: secretion system protein [Anaerolineae bacterium]
MAVTLLIVGGIVALGLLIAGAVISARTERSLVEDRLGRYLEDEAELREAATAQTEQKSFLTDWLNRRVEGSQRGERIARALAQADLKLKPGEFVAVRIIAAFGTAVVTYFAIAPDGPLKPAISLAGAVVGSFIPNLYLKRMQGKRLERFNDQLADMLNLMVNGLRAGYSTMQAMEAVSKELPPPISDEFRRVVQEMQLGIPMERALDNLLRRVPSDDLDLVVTAINVQREVGGNLAEVLDTISFTIRERVRIKGEIRVLTSQVMYSGRMLSVLPIALGLFLWVINRSYMMNFFLPENRVCGLGMLGCGIGMIIAGYFAMNKIADIEV